MWTVWQEGRTHLVRSCPGATTLLVVMAFVPTAAAQSAAGTDADPCAVPGMRTDLRPGAGGPPTEVSVGIRP